MKSIVALLVEVSVSSLNRDLAVKLPIYAAHGIPEYWIADVDRDVLLVHRQPAGQRYGDVREYGGDDPVAAPEVEFRAQAIFA
jgi:Uma2 family endonuclease